MKVFVYGSLKKGFWNNVVLGNSNLLGEAFTTEDFFMTSVGFPYIIPKNLVTKSDVNLLPIKGEVYEIDTDETLRRLDNLEGISYGHYKRTPITVIINDNVEEVMAYIPCDTEKAEQYLSVPETKIEDKEYYEWV